MSHPRKPRDVGNGLVCASFGQGGEWLSLATVDPEMGFVELTGLPLFDPELRDNAEAVLRYHSWMRREAHAFLHLEAGRATITTREDAPRGTRAVVQRVTVRATPRDRPPGIRLRVSGRLARPALVDVPPIGRTHRPATHRPAARRGRRRARGRRPGRWGRPDRCRGQHPVAEPAAARRRQVACQGPRRHPAPHWRRRSGGHPGLAAPGRWAGPSVRRSRGCAGSRGPAAGVDRAAAPHAHRGGVGRVAGRC